MTAMTMTMTMKYQELVDAKKMTQPGRSVIGDDLHPTKKT